MAVGDKLYVADKPTLDKAYEILLRLQAQVFNSQTFDWGTYFKAHETGELFSTKFYNYSVTDTGIGEKLNDNEGLTCTPSLGTAKGTDDYATHNAFWFVDCNFIIDDTGMKIPTYIEGQSGFKRTGKVDVGVLTPPLYWGREETDDGYIIHLSDKEVPDGHEDLTLTLCPWCRDTFGNAMPYGIVTKYYAGEIDGLYYSSSGNAIANFNSYQSTHTQMQKKGAGYYGSGSERSAYLKCMLWIKYATLNSQNYFTGCVNYSAQCANLEAATGVKYVTITTAQAASFYVGGTVSLGNCSNTSNTDRGQSYMRDIADKVKVTAIEAVEGTSNSRVYVDVDTAFDTTVADGDTVTTTTYISAMPLHSGQTDDVPGADGQVLNDNKHSFKIQGVEDGVGVYFVSANEVLNKETAAKTVLYARTTGEYKTALADIQSTYKEVASYENASSADIWIGEEILDLETGSTFIKTTGTGDKKGVSDRHYWGDTAAGLREYLTRGGLWLGSFAGLSCVAGGYGLSYAPWAFAPCV